MIALSQIGMSIVLIPFAAAMLSFVVGRKYAIAVTNITAVIMLVLCASFGHLILANGAHQYSVGGWESPLGIQLKFDGLCGLMLLVTTLVATGISFYANRYFLSSKKNPDEQGAGEIYFWPVWLFCWGGLNVLFVSSDIFNIYVALEIISFSAITLVALSGSVKSLVAATRYFFLTLIGSLSYLLGVGLLYGQYGALDISLLGSLISYEPVTIIALVLITSGILIKSALFPMHFWLPPAHSSAPAPVSAILSGLVVMGSFYLLVRLWFDLYIGIFGNSLGQFIGILGTIGIFFGAVMALLQDRLKMMLAYSTVSQIGYMFLLFPLFTDNTLVQQFAWNGGIYLAISHAFAKSSAFMVAGMVVYGIGHDKVSDLTGLAERFPLGVFTFGLAGVSLIGLPPSGGFIGKWMLLKAALLSSQWTYGVLIVFGSIISAAYMFRVFEIFMKKQEYNTQPLRIPQSMQWCAFIMALLAVVLGLLADIPLELLEVGFIKEII